MPETINEIELVDRLRQGDTNAFKILYEKYAPRLKAFGFRFNFTIEESEDIVQETFIKIWENRNELLNELPPSSQRFDLAISAVKKDIETQRIVKDGIIFSYLNAEKKGFDRDVRKDIYESLGNITLKDVEQMHKSDLAEKPYTYCIVASDKKVRSDDLKKIGEVKQLTLEEIFGY